MQPIPPLLYFQVVKLCGSNCLESLVDHKVSLEWFLIVLGPFVYVYYYRQRNSITAGHYSTVACCSLVIRVQQSGILRLPLQQLQTDIHLLSMGWGRYVTHHMTPHGSSTSTSTSKVGSSLCFQMPLGKESFPPLRASGNQGYALRCGQRMHICALDHDALLS